MLQLTARSLRGPAIAGAVAFLMMIGIQPAGAGSPARMVGEELSLSFDSQTWLNALSGEPVITGTIECPTVAQSVTITIEVEQPDGPGNSYGSGGKDLECDEPEVRWSINVRGDEFDTGAAAVDGYAVYEIDQTQVQRSDTTRFTSCTRIGTMEDDEIIGTQKKDKICGLDGDDEINGRGGNDTLRGSNGDDVVRGSVGDDIIFGGYGRDRLYGNGGNDRLTGNQNRDYLGGGSGNDRCRGGGGGDRVSSC